jgi:hypothetical protein
MDRALLGDKPLTGSVIRGSVTVSLVQVLRQEYLVHLVHVYRRKYLVQLHTLEHLVQVYRQVNLVQFRTGIINASIQAEIPGATTHTGALATRT